MSARRRSRSSGPASSASVFARLGLGMAAFGSATPLSKLVTSAMPVFVASAMRVAIGAITLAPFALKSRHELKKLRRGDWIRIGVIALAGMFGFSVFMLYGMKHVSGVAGAIVMSTTPALTAAASMTFLKERPTWRKLGAIALAVAGVLVLHLGSDSGSEGQDAPLGMVLVFCAVVCETTYTLLGKRLSERVDPVLVATVACVLATPLFVPFAIWQWSELRLENVSFGTWLALVFYGAGTLGLGSWLWYSGIAKTEGAVAAAFMGVMPVSALVLSYVLLHEAFRWIHLLGFASVFLGVLLISWEHGKMSAE